MLSAGILTKIHLRILKNFSVSFCLKLFRPGGAGFGGAGFSLQVLILAGANHRRLNPAPLVPDQNA
jgi:hypothetical protein